MTRSLLRSITSLQSAQLPKGAARGRRRLNSAVREFQVCLSGLAHCCRPAVTAVRALRLLTSLESGGVCADAAGVDPTWNQAESPCSA